MNAQEVTSLVGIVVRARVPVTSVDVAREYEKESGVKLNQTSVYRRLLKAAGDGKVRQDERRKWVAGPKLTPSMTAHVQPQVGNPARDNVPGSGAQPPDDERVTVATEHLRRAASCLEKKDMAGHSMWMRASDLVLRGS